MRKRGHIIEKVLPGSIAEELGLEKGDRLLGIRTADGELSEGEFFQERDIPEDGPFQDGELPEEEFFQDEEFSELSLIHI